MLTEQQIKQYSSANPDVLNAGTAAPAERTGHDAPADHAGQPAEPVRGMR